MSDQGNKHNDRAETQEGTGAADKSAGIVREQAGDELNSGKLNEKSKEETTRKFRSGRSGVSGLFESNGNGGLPKAKDLFGDLAHAPLTKEREPLLDQLKMASDQDQLLGAGGEFVDHTRGPSLAQVHREFPEESFSESLRRLHQNPDGPPENKMIPVDSLLRMQSDLRPATAASPTIRELVGIMNKQPWQVVATYEHPVKFPDYNPADNSIHIDSALSKQKQVDTFAHELYHATHQNLDELYGKPDAVGLDQYRKIKMDQESGAFLSEFKANKELKHTEPVSFDYVENNVIHKQRISDLISYTKDGSIDDTASKARIKEFLSTHRAPKSDDRGKLARDSNGTIQTNFYPDTHTHGYGDYLKNFEHNRQELLKKQWLGKGY